MKVRVISENTKRKTTMIVIHFEDANGCKRSQTRHCKRIGDTLTGYILDYERAILTLAEQESVQLANMVNSLNKSLDKKAKKSEPYNANLFFQWGLDDNSTSYTKHIKTETDRALRINAALMHEIEQLEALDEARRTQKTANAA